MCNIRTKEAKVILRLIHLYSFRKFSYMHCRGRCIQVSLSGHVDHSINHRVRVGFVALTVEMS